MDKKPEYKIGDEVVVVKIEDIPSEIYKSTLFTIGKISSIAVDGMYRVTFSNTLPPYNTWYYDDAELLLYSRDMNIETIKTLYGK